MNNENKAVRIETNLPGLVFTSGVDGFWMHVTTSDGRQAGINISLQNPQTGNIIGETLHVWMEETEDNSRKQYHKVDNALNIACEIYAFFRIKDSITKNDLPRIAALIRAKIKERK